MEHPTLEDAVKDLLSEKKEKWDQFFNGEWYISFMGSGFTVSAFVYEGKIWYGEEKCGSGTIYWEGKISDVVSLFLKEETKFNRSELNEKMDEVMKKREEGYLISDDMGKLDFLSRTKAKHISAFAGEDDSMLDMFDLGEHLTYLILNPGEYKYVQA